MIPSRMMRLFLLRQFVCSSMLKPRGKGHSWESMDLKPVFDYVPLELVDRLAAVGSQYAVLNFRCSMIWVSRSHMLLMQVRDGYMRCTRLLSKQAKLSAGESSGHCS